MGNGSHVVYWLSIICSYINFGGISDLCSSVNFIYSEKDTEFREISTVNLSYVLPMVIMVLPVKYTSLKYTVEILQNFVAFSKYMNFTIAIHLLYIYTTSNKDDRISGWVLTPISYPHTSSNFNAQVQHYILSSFCGPQTSL